jgi:hypothetical protein
MMSLKKRHVFRLFVLWLASYLVLMGFFLGTVLDNFSYIEIFPREMILPTIMHAFTALFIALAIYWLPWFRTFSGKLITGLMLALLMIGYDSNLQTVSGVVRAFIPGLTDSDPMPLVSLVYIILLFVVANAIGTGAELLIRKVDRIRPKDVELGLLALVAYLFLIPAFSVANILPTMIQETEVQAPELIGQESAALQDKPDIYYIVLDRYTNADVLKDQFSYDNTPFTGFLKDNDFYVKDKAYSNYPYTTMSVSSTLNGIYTNQLVALFKNNKTQSKTLYHNLIEQSSVAKAFKKNGYAYYSIGSSYGASYKAPLAEREYMYQHQVTIFGMNKRLRGIEALEFMKSPYFVLHNCLVWNGGL